MKAWRGRTIALAATAASLVLSACGVDDDWTSPSAAMVSRPATPADCHQQPVRSSPGAPAEWGLDVGGATPPAWSTKGGYIGTSAAAGRVFVGSPNGCVSAVDGRSGAVAWITPVGPSDSVMGVVASASVVVAASGSLHGTAPANVSPLTGRLVGLDPGTGAQRWSLSVLDDGQDVPATIAGDVVIVTEADGTVRGLDASTGAQRWRDAPPAACASQDAHQGSMPAVVPVPDLAVPLVEYRCRRSQVVRLDAATGAVRWTRTVPAGGWASYGGPTAASSGVIGLVLPGTIGTVAPVRHPAPPGPRQRLEKASFLAVSAATGRPLWQVDDIATEERVYAGAGRLCLWSRYGVACYAARDGRASWHRRPPVIPSAEEMVFGDGARSDAGRLYSVVPTAAAASIPARSTTYRSQPGTFHLTVTAIASGRIISDIPLPAYYGDGRAVVVSVDTPPGVVAVGGGKVLLSPELHESDVIEAFPTA